MKRSKHFEVSVPFTKKVIEDGRERTRHIIDLIFCGVAENRDGELDYDIDEVFYIDHKAKCVPVAREVMEALGFDPKEDDHVNGAILNHISGLDFEPRRVVDEENVYPKDVYEFFGSILSPDAIQKFNESKKRA